MEIAEERYDYAIPLIIAFVLVFNALAMITLRKRNDRDHLIRLLLIFIWNLSICDVLVGIMLIVNTILYHIHRNIEHSDQRKQTIWKTMRILENLVVRMTLIVAATILFVVTLIRIMALTKTYFRYRINRSVVLNINICIWIGAALVAGCYNCLFEFYLTRKGFGNLEEVLVPIFIIPSVFILTGCHVLILKILRSHGMSMQTYLETLRNYVSTRSLKSKSARNLFTATFGRRKKSAIKKPRDDISQHTSARNSVIIENHYVSNQKINIQTDLKQLEKDKERCRKQVKFLFSTKDISLLRFEVFAFLICWLPLALVELFHILNIDDTWYTYDVMRQYTLMIVFLKSAFTPCVYLMHKKHELFCFQKTSARTTESSTLTSSCSTITTVM